MRLGVLVLVVLLLLVCVALPLALSLNGFHWLAVVAAAAATALWLRQVRSQPGFLQGIVCLSGLSMILGVFLATLVRAIGAFFD